MRATFTHLVGPYKGERTTFDSNRISIGRAPDNKLCFGDAARRVSSHHAEVIRRGDEFILRDLGSTNGTMINGRRVVAGELAHDDLIEFGAGGPLLRFAVVGDSGEDELHGIVERHPNEERLNESLHRRPPNALRLNARWVAGLVAAMVLGGVVGIVASSRIRTSEPEALSFAEIAEMNSPAVVLIQTEFELLDSTGQVTTTEARTGSGFLISESGLIVTNRHLVRDWEYNPSLTGSTGRITKIEVILAHQKRGDSLPAEIYKLGPDSSVDVAILKINSPNSPFVPALEADLNRTSQGDEVVVIGYPLGLDLLKEMRDNTVDPSLSLGIVSRVGHDFIQLNLRAYHGNSGGPVLNRKGEVIGILTGRLGAAPEITLCIPIASAVALVKGEHGLSTTGKE